MKTISFRLFVGPRGRTINVGGRGNLGAGGCETRAPGRVDPRAPGPRPPVRDFVGPSGNVFCEGRSASWSSGATMTAGTFGSVAGGRVDGMACGRTDA